MRRRSRSGGSGGSGCRTLSWNPFAEPGRRTRSHGTRSPPWNPFPWNPFPWNPFSWNPFPWNPFPWKPPPWNPRRRRGIHTRPRGRGRVVVVRVQDGKVRDQLANHRAPPRCHVPLHLLDARSPAGEGRAVTFSSASHPVSHLRWGFLILAGSASAPLRTHRGPSQLVELVSVRHRAAIMRARGGAHAQVDESRRGIALRRLLTDRHMGGRIDASNQQGSVKAKEVPS